MQPVMRANNPAFRPILLTVLCIAEITAAFETAMIYSVVGKLIKVYGDPVKVGWLVTIYLLIGAAAAAVVARLGDIYGRRRTMLILLAITGFASLLSASSPNLGWLVVGRGLQGLAAAILPLCIGLARENVEPPRMPMAIGIIMSGAAAGTAMGLLLGGVIADHFDWHGVFYASAAMAALALVLIALIVPVSPRSAMPAEGIDFASAGLFVPGLIALLLAISNIRDWGWTDWRVAALAALGIGLLLVWIVRSLRLPAPLIDVRLFADRRVAVANLSYALLSLGSVQLTLVFAIVLQSPTWTGIGLGLTATAAGLIKLPSNLLALFAGPLAGYLNVRIGRRLTMALGGLMATAGWTGALQMHHAAWMIGAWMCIISFGTSFVYSTGPTVVVDAVPMERTGEATGMLAVVRSVAMGIGALVIGVLLATSTVTRASEAGAYPDSRAFTLTVLAITALTLASALAALLLPRDGKSA